MPCINIAVGKIEAPYKSNGNRRENGGETALAIP